MKNLVTILVLSTLILSGCGGRKLRTNNSEVTDPVEEFSCRVLASQNKVSAYADENGSLYPNHLPPFANLSVQAFMGNQQVSYRAVGVQADPSKLEIVNNFSQTTIDVRPKEFGRHSIQFSVAFVEDSTKITNCGTEIELEALASPEDPEVQLTTNAGDSPTIATLGFTILNYNSVNAESCQTYFYQPGSSNRTALNYNGITNEFPSGVLLNSGEAPAVYRFEVECENIVGVAANDTVQVTVNPEPEMDAFFTVNGNNVNNSISVSPGQAFALSWSSEWANRCSLSTNAGIATPLPSSGTRVFSGGVVASSSYTIYCYDSADNEIQKSLTALVLPPSATLTLNGGTNPISKNFEDDFQLVWTSQNTTQCSLSGGGVSSTQLNGSLSIPNDEINETTTFTLRCQDAGGSVTKNVTVNVNYVEAYVAYTAKGDFDIRISDLVGNADFQNMDFGSNKFKITIDVRMLSMINYQGKASYELSDMSLSQNSNSAGIVSITRNFAERTGGGSCTAVPDSVFAASQVNRGIVLDNATIDLSAQPANTYIYKFEARERFATSSQGCYPSIHSGRRQAAAAVVSAPTFSGHPYASDGYSNTYGNGTYIYVDGAGKIRLRYKTQRAESRAVFVVGVIALKP